VVLWVLRNVAAAAPEDSRQEEIEVQSIGIPSNLTEAPLIWHLNQSIIGRGLFLQPQRHGERRAAPDKKYGTLLLARPLD
jgi:hypothetical protein